MELYGILEAEHTKLQAKMAHEEEARCAADTHASALLEALQSLAADHHASIDKYNLLEAQHAILESKLADEVEARRASDADNRVLVGALLRRDANHQGDEASDAHSRTLLGTLLRQDADHQAVVDNYNLLEAQHAILEAKLADEVEARCASDADNRVLVEALWSLAAYHYEARIDKCNLLEAQHAMLTKRAAEAEGECHDLSRKLAKYCHAEAEYRCTSS